MEQKEIILFIVVVSIAIAIFIAAIILFVIFYRNKVIRQKQEYQKMKLSHQKELLATQIEMQQQTMQHIGREIHDDIGQQLTLASLYAQQLAYENEAPQINEKIQNIGQIINNSLTALRQLSKTLTDDSIAQNGIVSLLQIECDKVTNFKTCQFRVDPSLKSLQLSYEVKSILVRIAQEFIQNSIKHADCQSIQIALLKTDNLLEIILEDDGKGFNTQVTGKGIGLNNIKKRTEMIHGSYHIKSQNTGTKLTIQIPI
jgi:signal transduction histidine kinase